MKSKGEKLSTQTIAFVGAGSASFGIAEQIISQMISEGISAEQARKQVFMIDRYGLLTAGVSDLRDFQNTLAQATAVTKNWEITGDYASIVEVINGAKPSMLIGVSG